MTSQKKFILFDFDGVISNSFDIALKTAQTLCVHMTEEEYRSAFRGNIYETHHKMMPDTHGPECQHDRNWFEVYIPMFEEGATPFSGIEEVIQKLSHEHVLIIVSSSEHSPIQGFLEKYHLGRYFSEIMGNEVHKHKAEKIRMIFEKYNIVAKDCVFITDTLGDMNEASEKGVGSIGVTWGWHSRETLEQGKPFRIVDTPQEINPAISDYFAGKPSVSD
ncbi:HAD family hydrolase [Candidatus Parcubacteria bacterium]|nr:MAG: HAD family hydrolase [Candidatus Parcubacteria bacterium]